MNKTQIILRDAYKQYTLDQDKIFSPDETVIHFKKRLKNIDLDILEKTFRIDNGRLDIPVYFSLCGEDAVKTIGTKKQMGKGATPSQAEASAVMELAERYSFFNFIKDDSNFIVDTYDNLKNEAIPFELIAQSVHDHSENMDISMKIFKNLPMRWTWAYNMNRNTEMLVPFDWFYTINEFNGTSAGNCIEEALCQGICEVVERHVSAIISRNRIQPPRIDAESVKDPLAREMISKYTRCGIQLVISDFSLDTGIPSIGVMAYDPSTFPNLSEIVWTAGTTPNPEKALSRALSEVAQLAGDFNTKSNYVASGLPKFKTLEDAKYVMASDEVMPIQSLPDLSHPNIKIEIENLIQKLGRKNLEVLTINTTHPILQIPAFYTIIPGAYFRERAVNTSVGMFTAKLIIEKYDTAQAISELKRMESNIGETYYIMFYTGIAYLSWNNYATSLEYFKKALELNPSDQDIPSIYSYIGVCMKEMGEYQAAIEMLKMGETYDAGRTDIYNLMGFCYYKLKQHTKAIECFQQVLRINPNSAIDYANIASNYRDMGNIENAIQFYQVALMLDPEIEFAKNNLKKLLSLK